MWLLKWNVMCKSIKCSQCERPTPSCQLKNGLCNGCITDNKKKVNVPNQPNNNPQPPRRWFL